MRILNVTQSYAPFFEFGGPPVKVRALAEGLARHGHSVTVLTADWKLDRRLAAMPGESPAVPGPFGRKREVNGVTSIYLPTWLHYRAVSWNPSLGRFLRARLAQFDVVHIFGLYDFLGPAVASACRERQLPYIVEPIGMFVPIVRSFFLKRLYHRFYGRDLLGSAAALIATSEQERSELLAGGFPAGKIGLRRNGVDFPSSFPERGCLRSSLGISPDSRVLLFLGRLSLKKSPDMLLESFASLSSTSDLHLLFVGPDEAGMRSRLESRAAALGLTSRVHFLGPLEGDSKWSAYRDADIFVLPSQNENFGNTAAEAVAAGTPVVLTDQCGIAPWLRDTAALVVPHDQQRLTSALRSLLTDSALYRRLQAACPAAAGRLGWGPPLLEMENLYARLVGLSQS